LTLVSITVCARDAENWVEQCLSSLVSQDYRPIEIIAVDDGSSDGTLDQMLEFRDLNTNDDIEITVISSKPLGLSSGRQLALESAKGEWVAITDIDCCPESNWISVMMSFRDNLPGENIVAVTGRTEFAEGNTKVSRIRSKSIRRKYEQRSRVVTLANGPCSVFRKDALISIGGFDPNWYHAEDMEVSLLLIQNGGTIIHTSDALVRHVAEEDLSVFLRKRCRDARAHMRILQKYGLHGIKLHNGDVQKHDFVSDAARMIWLSPILILGISVCNFGLVVSTPPLWWGIALTTLVLILLLGIKKNEFLWSLSLWYGAFLGLCDAILKRRGH